MNLSRPQRWHGHSFLGLVFTLLLATTSGAQISGNVVDSVSGTPISDALVSLQATTIQTVTGTDGTFDLDGADGTDLVIVGAAKGYFNHSVLVTTPASSIQIALDPVPQDDNQDYVFLSPNACRGCHPDQFNQWNGSPMNNAGTNNWVYDIYDGTGTAGGMGGFVYTRDSRFAASNPASECAACHQPEPWVETPFSAMDPIDMLSTGALHGISCEVCHKMAHIDESKVNFPGIFPGAVTMTRPAATAPSQVQYGSLGDTDFNVPSIMRSSYQPQLGAAVCAACHQDKNDPDQDHDYEEGNGVISEPTYLEWLASPFGDIDSPLYTDCVDCHMPPFGAENVCNTIDLVRDPDTIRHHRIEGTTAAYLENAVDMSLEVTIIDGYVEADVAITNSLTGHHVPTGVTIRNMILLVEAWRESDSAALSYVGTQVVHELGGVGDPAQGYYAGQPGKFFAKVNHDQDGNGPTFFTDATGIQFDSRIAALETDRSHYSFQIPAGEDVYHVRARLIYRRSFRFLTDAKGWTTDGHGNPLADVTAPNYGHLMETAEWSQGATTVAARAFHNHPNPTSAVTSIGFEMAKAGKATMTIYDIRGRKINTVAQATFGVGRHHVSWDGTNQAGHAVESGIYIYRLITDSGQTQSRRMTLIR